MSTEGSLVETTIALVRHGESSSNAEKTFGGHGPAPLTELGQAQALATGTFLAASWEPTTIVSSDLVRAAQTAEHVAQAAGLKLETTPGLRERGLGRLDGLAFREVRERFPEDWHRLISRDPDWESPGGGESTRSAFHRVSVAVDDIVRRHAGGRVVVVSHGVAIYLAFAHICGIDPFRDPTRVFIHVDNCSITRAVHLSQGPWRLDGLNDTHHLSATNRP